MENEFMRTLNKKGAPTEHEFTRTLRDDPQGPSIFEFLETTLENFRVDRSRLEDEAVSQMDLAKGAGVEYIAAQAEFKDAEQKRDAMFFEIAEAERGTGEKMTETALKQRVNKDARMVRLNEAVTRGELRLEAAKLALKFYWERGENIRALLFSRNTEMRALGAPASGGGTTSSLDGPKAGDITRRASAKFGKKG